LIVLWAWRLLFFIVYRYQIKGHKSGLCMAKEFGVYRNIKYSFLLPFSNSVSNYSNSPKFVDLIIVQWPLVRLGTYGLPRRYHWSKSDLLSSGPFVWILCIRNRWETLNSSTNIICDENLVDHWVKVSADKPYIAFAMSTGNTSFSDTSQSFIPEKSVCKLKNFMELTL